MLKQLDGQRDAYRKGYGDEMSEHRRRFIDTRVLDDLGRVVIPKEARQLLGLSEGTRVKILVEDDKRIVFEATEDVCPSCGR